MAKKTQTEINRNNFKSPNNPLIKGNNPLLEANFKTQYIYVYIDKT